MSICTIQMYRQIEQPSDDLSLESRSLDTQLIQQNTRCILTTTPACVSPCLLRTFYVIKPWLHCCISIMARSRRNCLSRAEWMLPLSFIFNLLPDKVLRSLLYHAT